MASDSVEYNELNRCVPLAVVGTFLLIFFILEEIEINEQLSVRNSLNALCCQSNCMNCFLSSELASVCLGTEHKMAIINRS